MPLANGKRSLVHLEKRGSRGNIALFEFAQPMAGRDVAALDLRAAAGERLAAFRFTSPNSPTPEVIFVRARREADRLVLSDPVDSRAWGSPLVSTFGIAGVVQDEYSALTMKEAFAAVGLNRGHLVYLH